MILNYNGKHTEVLLERLVGTQPTHPFAPLQRRHQYQTWVILLRTELSTVNSRTWGISRPTDNCDGGENQFAVSQYVLGSFSLSGVFNYLGWSSIACFVIIMKSEEHKTSLQQGTAIKSVLRAGKESRASDQLFASSNDYQVCRQKKGELANSAWQIQFCHWSRQWPSDSGTAFLLSWGQLSPALPSPSSPCSTGQEPKVAEPWQRPRAKLPVGMSPGTLIKLGSFLHSWVISYETKHQKRHMWAKWGHSGSGRCCKWSSIGGWPLLSTPGTPQLLIQTNYFRNYHD